MRVLALAATVASLLADTARADKDSSINVSLRTSFNAAPYLIELLETAALENSTSYFPLLDKIADGVFAELNSEQDLYQNFIHLLQEEGHIQDEPALSSFKFALSLHAAAPRIAAQYQYYETAVSLSIPAGQDGACPAWVHLDGKQYCSPELERYQQPISNDELEKELPFDHTLNPGNSQLISTLYADISSPLFAHFHQTVSQSAKNGETAYRVRYIAPAAQAYDPLYASGYGVELVLKRTDYIVIDDRDAKADSAVEKTTKQNATAHLGPLTQSQVSILGLNAADYIMASDDPLSTLLEINANFPKYSSQIVSSDVHEDLLIELRKNREVLLPSGFNIMWMNGLQIQHRDMNAFSILDILRKERELIGRLQAIGLAASEAIDLLSHEVLTQAQSQDQAQRYDWRDTQDGGDVILWLNDIEKDARYSSWPPSVNALLQRMYPGQLPQVRKNIHNVILPLDLHNIKDLDLIVNTLQMMIARGFPIRVGIVPIGDAQPSRSAAKLAFYIQRTYGFEGLMQFLQDVVVSKVGLNSFKASFESLTRRATMNENAEKLSFAAILEQDDGPRSEAVARYQLRLALAAGKAPILVNGVAVPRTENWFDAVTQRIYLDHRSLQLAVYDQVIDDRTSVVAHLLETALARRNTIIIPTDKTEVKILNVAELEAEHPCLGNLPRLAGDESAVLLSNRAHLLAVLDLDSSQAVTTVAELTTFHRAQPEVEILLLHNPSGTDTRTKVSRALYDKTRTLPHSLSDDELINIFAGEASTVDPQTDEAAQYWSGADSLINRLGLKAGENGFWLNGRVLAPITTPFLAPDFESLLEYEKLERITPVTTAISALGLEDKFLRPLDIAKVTSIVALSTLSDVPEGIYEAAPLIRIDRFKKWRGEHTMVHIPADTDATIQLVLAIDPASEVAQNWLPLIKALSELAGIDVKIYLNPAEAIKELPVKRFYRNVISSAPKFHGNGSLVVPSASFSGIPADTLFNLGMVVPPAWLVSANESSYDLDNIKLSTVPTGQNVNALYQLDYILIEGHSRETLKGNPPRGVQLLLGTDANPHTTDTIIMANLGYFQLKANPGYWNIELKSGRSSKIFTLDSLGSKGYEPQAEDEGTDVSLISFQGATLYPRLSRKAGMETEDVLESTTLSDTASSYLKKGQSLLSSFGLGRSAKSVDVLQQAQADINIFSVASGHLYERMLSIMMLSVMRHKQAQHTVKFWFISQFLSPSFKRTLPILSEHYGFRYELVTYKWPHWLRAQKEKQREIWGYKILYLDVLFPVDLDKVIFVDADQIVRTDMMELNNVDLHDAPYGFTPMCDSRTEMEGFRFWKTGYWKKFLEGKPYHISALYVVDLKKFRQLAAGDRLRGQYHALSQDPNSLSNLDQDLPNHMQHNLPIHSLDQDWLWCETWCSDEALKTARTIDLCNNPETKEPKLDRARRQVPEWTEYDDEIAAVIKAATRKDDRTEEVDLRAGSEKQNAELFPDGMDKAKVQQKKEKVGIKDEL